MGKKLTERATNAKKGIVSFMLEGSAKKSALEKIDQKAATKAAEKAKKAEKKRERVEAKAKKKTNRVPFGEKVKSFCFVRNNEEMVETDELHKAFWDKESDDSYAAVLISAEDVLDENFKAFSKENLKGQKLLKRDLKTSALYVDDEKNLLRVISLKQVCPETEDADTAYVLLETKYEFFVIEFKAIRSF